MGFDSKTGGRTSAFCILPFLLPQSPQFRGGEADQRCRLKAAIQEASVAAVPGGGRLRKAERQKEEGGSQNLEGDSRNS